MSHIPFIIRSATPEDKNFIYHSFLRSLHQHYPMKFVPSTIFYPAQQEILAFLYENSTVSVACFPEDPVEIIGWCIHQKMSEVFVIHYLYVKGGLRGNYIARDIVKEIIGDNSLIIASHICDHYDQMKYKLPGVKVIYDPFIISKLRVMYDAG